MKISILPKAVKTLSKIPDDIQTKIIRRIDDLAVDALPKSSKKLTNQPGYRIRVGDWRILYIVDKKKRLVIIARIAHRKDVYR